MQMPPPRRGPLSSGVRLVTARRPILRRPRFMLARILTSEMSRRGSILQATKPPAAEAASARAGNGLVVRSSALSKNWPTSTGQGALRTWSPPMTAESSVEEEPHDHTPHRACCRAWRRRRGVERPVRKYPNPNRTKDLRPGARGLAWRLVLAARRRFAATTGPYGVHADPDRAWRTLASDEPGHQSRYPHRRCGQSLQMGGPQRRRSGRAFLRR